MAIDFGWMDDIAAGGCTNADKKENQPAPLGRLQRRIDIQRADHELCLQVYKTYLENEKASSQLRADILKGVRAGTDPSLLLLKAVEAIARMTNDQLFYEEVKRDLLNIHGKALISPVPLLLELEAVEKRLVLLQQAVEQETSTDGKYRIQAAIKAHKEEANRLQELIRMVDKQQRAI